METKLKQEPVADGGGLPKPYVVTKEDEEQAKVVPSEIARPFVARLVACERQLASSQEALRAAREENERLKRTVNLVAGGAAQGVMLHSKITNAYLAGKRESENYFEERMQQAVAELEPCVSHYLNQPVRTGITKAIKLLSPEGSSR